MYQSAADVKCSRVTAAIVELGASLAGGVEEHSSRPDGARLGRADAVRLANIEKW